MKRYTCIFVLAAALSGCGGVLTSEESPLREYWLMPDAKLLTPDPRLEGVTLNIAVAAPRGMDRRELLHLEPSGQLKEYAGARWTDDASVVVANYIDLALEQATGIEPAGGASTGEATLRLELRAMYTRGTATNDEAILHVMSRITCQDESSAQGLSFASPLRSAQLAAMVAAHRENLDALSRHLRDQLVVTCSASMGD